MNEDIPYEKKERLREREEKNKVKLLYSILNGLEKICCDWFFSLLLPFK